MDAPKFGDSDPVNFKGKTPATYAVHGADVSKFQGDVDWAAAKEAGISFAFIKATEGGDHKDDRFTENWRKAKSAGIPRGAYHFYYFCTSAAKQARWFIANVPKEAGSLPPVLDMEWNNHSPTCKKRPKREKVISEMRIFLRMIERHYGRRPIIYTAPDFYETNIEGAFTGHPMWLRSVTTHPKEIYGSRPWRLWQYTGTGRAPGFKGNVDLNVFNGSRAEWRNWLQTAGS